MGGRWRNARGDVAVVDRVTGADKCRRARAGGVIQADRERYTLGPTRTGRRKAAEDGQGRPKGPASGRMRPLHHRCVGCGPKARPAGQTGHSRCAGDREIDAGEPGGGEPPRRLSGGARRGGRCIHAKKCEGARPPDRGPGQDEARVVVPDEAQARSAGAAAPVRRTVRRDRRRSRSSHAKHGAKADDAMAERHSGGADGGSAQRDAGGEHTGARGSERTGDGRAQRARGHCGRGPGVRTRKRAAPPPPVAGDDDAARVSAVVRPRRAEPGCRAAAPCRRGSR